MACFDGYSMNETPLMKAIDNGLVKLAYYLIEKWNADVNYVPIINNEQNLIHSLSWHAIFVQKMIFYLKKNVFYVNTL